MLRLNGVLIFKRVYKIRGSHIEKWNTIISIIHSLRLKWQAYPRCYSEGNLFSKQEKTRIYLWNVETMEIINDKIYKMRLSREKSS